MFYFSNKQYESKGFQELKRWKLKQDCISIVVGAVILTGLGLAAIPAFSEVDGILPTASQASANLNARGQKFSRKEYRENLKEIARQLNDAPIAFLVVRDVWMASQLKTAAINQGYTCEFKRLLYPEGEQYDITISLP